MPSQGAIQLQLFMVKENKILKKYVHHVLKFKKLRVF